MSAHSLAWQPVALELVPGWAFFDLHNPAKEGNQLIRWAAPIVSGIVIVLLLLACRYDHVVVAERREQNFRRWKQKQDRERNESALDDD